MTAEETNKYCFGLIDLRCGTKIIAILNISVLFLAIVLNIIYLAMVLGIKARLLPSNYKKIGDITRKALRRTPCKKWLSNEAEETTTNRINTIHGLCASSFMEIILLYFNLRLKKSIHEQNVQNIKHWLMIYIMVLIHILIYYISAAFVSDQPLFFLCVGLISSVIVLLMMYVVRRFYLNELEHLVPSNTTDEKNVTPSQSA